MTPEEAERLGVRLPGPLTPEQQRALGPRRKRRPAPTDGLRFHRVTMDAAKSRGTVTVWTAALDGDTLGTWTATGSGMTQAEWRRVMKDRAADRLARESAPALAHRHGLGEDEARAALRDVIRGLLG